MDLGLGISGSAAPQTSQRSIPSTGARKVASRGGPSGGGSSDVVVGGALPSGLTELELENLCRLQYSKWTSMDDYVAEVGSMPEVWPCSGLNKSTRIKVHPCPQHEPSQTPSSVPHENKATRLHAPAHMKATPPPACEFRGSDDPFLPLNPKPKPSTLNPQPSTLNPQPSTLNPQPQTHRGNQENTTGRSLLSCKPNGKRPGGLREGASEVGAWMSERGS